MLISRVRGWLINDRYCPSSTETNRQIRTDRQTDRWMDGLREREGGGGEKEKEAHRRHRETE